MCAVGSAHSMDREATGRRHIPKRYVTQRKISSTMVTSFSGMIYCYYKDYVCLSF